MPHVINAAGQRVYRGPDFDKSALEIDGFVFKAVDRFIRNGRLAARDRLNGKAA